jgi:predicted amidophosphoribosyltransferase
MPSLGKLLSALSYVLLPPICGVCGERLEPEEEAVCGVCRSRFQEMGRSICSFCGSAVRQPSTRRCEQCPRPEAYFQSAPRGVSLRHADGGGHSGLQIQPAL